MTPEELTKAVSPSGAGIVAACHVRPGASKTVLSGLYGDAIKLSLKAPPVDGKANRELCRFFAEKCGVPNGAVSLVSGQTSRSKRVLISGIGLETFIRVFSDD